MDQTAMDFDIVVTGVDSVIERMPNPNWKMERTIYEHYQVLCAALQGEAEYRLYDSQQSKFRVQKDDVMLFTRLCPRRAVTVPENPWRFVSILFRVDESNPEMEKQLLQLPMVTHHTSPGILALFQEASRLWVEKGPAYKMKCRALTEEILYELVHSNTSDVDPRHYEMIESVRRYLQEHCSENFTVERLAGMARCSPSHFRMLFKKIVGMTANQYQTAVRIGKAKDFLLSREMNVSEAAEAVGYRDIFYFSRQFKAVTGHPPSFYIP